MIEDTYALMMARLQNVRPTGHSSHMPQFMFEPSEVELLDMGRYVERTPDSYPTGLGEQQGLRSIRNASKAQHLNMELRVGMTTLHICEKGVKENLEAIALTYMGGSETFHVGPARALTANAVTLVLLLGNGVVTALYRQSTSPFGHVISCRPPGKEGYAGWPYPTKPSDILGPLESQVSCHGDSTETKAFKALPELVMFAIDVHKQSS